MQRRNQIVVGVVATLVAFAALVAYASRSDSSGDTGGQPSSAGSDAGAATEGAESDAAPEPTGPTSVEAHGADGTDDADDTKAIVDALAAADDGHVEFGAGTFLIDRPLIVPPEVSEVVLSADTVIRQTADAPVFVRRGAITDGPVSVTGAESGSQRLEVSDAGPAAGDWTVIATSRVVEQGKAFRLGSLRQVTATEADTIDLDRPLVRDLTADTELWTMELAPPLVISGGALEQADPLGSFSPLVLFEWALEPRLDGVELRDCGGSGVKVIGTVGGALDVSVHDCVDDHAGARFDRGRHYGYGVEVTGPTRDLAVTGQASAVRHAFTTNGSFPTADDRLVNVGEPENIDVSMDVRDTTSSGLDTHEIGHGIRFHDCRVEDAGRYKREGSNDGKEGGFGIYVRASNTIVENCEIVGAAVSGIVVASPSPGFDAWSGEGATRVIDTRITQNRGRAAVQLKQPAVLRGVQITGSHRFGIQFERAGEQSSVTGSTISLAGDETTFAFVSAGQAQLRDNVISTDEREFG